ncbi:hypothetical protein PIB30_054103 [Stylosanthes scabra]|uniref:Uncharacterized protein n=1 Tax=Stylosanthes scabra TaxID=79078 RepID=A0ABU6SJ90_9FABA|nr:hypothetical protein [Stylosanthes scabra]
MSGYRSHEPPPPPPSASNRRTPAATSCSVANTNHQPPTRLDQFGISSRRRHSRSRAVVSSSLTSPRRRRLEACSHLSLPCGLQTGRFRQFWDEAAENRHIVEAIPAIPDYMRRVTPSI